MVGQIGAIFFDLDDTLFDATNLAQKARRAAIESMIEKGLSCITPDQGYAMLCEIVEEFGSNNDRHFDMLLKRLNILPPLSSKLVTAAIITYHRIKLQEIKLYQDVFGFLQFVKSWPPFQTKSPPFLGIITDGIPVKQWEKILRLGLDPYFQHVFISDEIGIRKPNPALFRWALEKTGVQAANAFYVGDRYDHDLVPAKNVGMMTCFIHRDGKYDSTLTDEQKTLIDVEIESLTELEEWIKARA